MPKFMWFQVGYAVSYSGAVTVRATSVVDAERAVRVRAERGELAKQDLSLAVGRCERVADEEALG